MLDLRGQVRERVCSSLREFLISFTMFHVLNDAIDIILNDDKVRVPWSNYEWFVSRHHVILEGWPNAFPMDPEKLALPGLATVLQALNDGVCKWHQISDEEYAERVNCLRSSGKLPQPKKRAVRSDAGKKRAALAQLINSDNPRVRSRSVIENSDEEMDG